MGRLVKVTDAANNQTTMTYDTLGRKTGMTDPDMGTWSYAYDANGNMTSQTDAKNQTITFIYDALNRVTQKNYPTGTPVVYTYDETFAANGKGRLTTVTDSTGSDKYYYDKHGRVVKNTQTIDATDYTTETTYDALNRVKTLKYPDGEIVTNSYGRDGGLNAVNGYVTYSNFNALGQPGTVTYANGVITNYQYNAQNNRLYSITTNSPTQGLQNISYAYDNVGNITTLTDHMDATNTQTFTYDHLSRLTKAVSSYGELTWEYNQIGNMTNNSQLGAYTYSTTKPHAVVQAGANVYAYDANGNMSSRKGVAITWNYDNKTSQMGTVQFAYDHSGARVKKIGATPTVYVGKLYECTSGVCTKYIFGLAKVASKKGSSTYFYHGDHLGSANVVTDQTGAKVQEVKYYPFGGMRSNVGSVNVKHKYTDQEEDPEYGLYYYNARYYDPELSRFVSADSIIPDPSDPQDFNRYSYVSNNPIIYIDPSGHETMSFISVADVYLSGYGSGSSWGFGNYGSSSSFYLGGGGYNFSSSFGGMSIYGSFSSGLAGFGGGSGGGYNAFGGKSSSSASFASQLAMMQTMNNMMAAATAAKSSPTAAVQSANSALSGFKSAVMSRMESNIMSQLQRGDEVSAFFTTFGRAAVGLLAPEDVTGVAMSFAGPLKIVKGAGTVLKTANFTKSNYRLNLVHASGIDPGKAAQAHHIFPVKFEPIFSSKGINIHDPQFLSWWETSSHLRSASEYNMAWSRFLRNDPSSSEMMNYGRKLMGDYGITVRF